MKRISPGTVTIGVFAILFGLVTAYAVRHYFNTPAAEPPAAKTVAVVVPAVNLPKYSRIREQDLNLVKIPIKDLPKGAVRLRSRALYRLVKKTIMAGRPILEKDLYGVGEVPMLSEQLPPGHRAVTLQVNANSALNGMIQPESYVDVTLTANSNRPELGGMTTVTLLKGVKVLATSGARFPRSEDRPTNLRNITVAVSPKQANKLILAQRYGTLSVTLCSSLDEGSLAKADGGGDAVHPNDLLGLVLQPAPQPVQKTVQIWRGGQMQEITFTEGQIRESLSATIVSDRSKPTVARPVSSRHQGPVAEPPVSSGRGDAETGNLPTPAPRPKTSASKKDCPSCNKGKSSQQPVYVTVETKGAGIEVGVQDN